MLIFPSPESGPANPVSDFANTKVLQGYLEGSNVDVAQELIQMIMTQRSFELNSKAVQASDETMGIAVNLKR
jgi:flagellar basal-body rod protein FlgG